MTPFYPPISKTEMGGRKIGESFQKQKWGEEKIRCIPKTKMGEGKFTLPHFCSAKWGRAGRGLGISLPRHEYYFYPCSDNPGILRKT